MKRRIVTVKQWYASVLAQTIVGGMFGSAVLFLLFGDESVPMIALGWVGLAIGFLIVHLREQDLNNGPK